MNFLPEKNYYKDIFRLALPAIAGLSTQMVVSLVDAAMVGRLENTKYVLAAMGIGVLATWALVSFFSSLATGTHVIVARKYGEKNYDACSVALNNSIIIALTIGVAVMFVSVFAAKHFAHLLAADPIVGDYAAQFIFFRFLGIPAFLVSVSYRGFFFGINQTKIFMFSGIMTNVLNIVFNFFLIYGSYGVVPKMGLAGAGLGSTLATTFDFLFYFTVSQLPSYRNRYRTLKNFKIDFKVIRQIYIISLPVSFQNVFILLGFLSFITIMGFIGIKEQAATQAVISTLFISFLPCFGFGIAAQTLVGNCIGSRKFNLAKIYGLETAKVASYYTILLGIVFILLPQYVLTIITTNQAIIDVAKPALRIAGFAQMFYGVGVVLANGLQSAGKTLYVMLSESITNLLVFVPLAYFFGIFLKGGLIGAWLALPIYIILYSSVIFIKFTYGDWKT
jgi:multidrug resistance protein, MATE family